MRAPSLLIVALFCLVPAAAFAQADDETNLFGLELDLGSRLVYSGSFEAFSRNPAMGTIHLSASWLPAGFERRLAVDARFGRAGTSARNFRLFDAALDLTQLSAGAAYRHPVIDRLVAVGRVGAGAEYVRARIDDGAGPSLTGGAWSPLVEGTAGIEVVAPLVLAHGGERHVALRVEGGYGWRPFGAEIGRLERPLEDSDPERVGSVPVDLGRVDLSGWVLRGAIAFRF